jgi:hypothetical protein
MEKMDKNNLDKRVISGMATEVDNIILGKFYENIKKSVDRMEISADYEFGHFSDITRSYGIFSENKEFKFRVSVTEEDSFVSIYVSEAHPRIRGHDYYSLIELIYLLYPEMRLTEKKLTWQKQLTGYIELVLRDLQLLFKSQIKVNIYDVHPRDYADYKNIWESEELTPIWQFFQCARGFFLMNLKRKQRKVYLGHHISPSIIPTDQMDDKSDPNQFQTPHIRFDFTDHTGIAVMQYQFKEVIYLKCFKYTLAQNNYAEPAINTYQEVVWAKIPSKSSMEELKKNQNEFFRLVKEVLEKNEPQTLKDLIESDYLGSLNRNRLKLKDYKFNPEISSEEAIEYDSKYFRVRFTGDIGKAHVSIASNKDPHNWWTLESVIDEIGVPFDSELNKQIEALDDWNGDIQAIVDKDTRQ